MSHIFISYSRKDVDFASKIVQALADNALDTWIDWKNIPKGEDWEQEIYRGIEEADAFLFLISPDSVASEICNKEIDHAVKNGKRILPIVIRDADRKDIHPEISKRNWIFCRDGQDDFNKAIEETRRTIHTDYEWLKYHTKLQLRALDWEKQKDDNSRLLRGKGLHEAKQALIDYGLREDPKLTNLQYEFVRVSQKDHERQRNLGLIIGTFFGILLLVLVFFAQFQSNIASINEATAQAAKTGEAEQFAIAQAISTKRAAAEATSQAESNTALVRKLTSQSLAHIGQEFDLALLLSVEANNIQPSTESWNAIVTLLEELPHTIHQPATLSEATAIEYSPDGKILAIGGRAELVGVIFLVDTSTGNVIGKLEYPDSFLVISIAFDPTGKLLATSYDTDVIILWDIETKTMHEEPLISAESGLGISNLAFSSDGMKLFVAYNLSAIQEWDLNTTPATEGRFEQSPEFTVAMTADAKGMRMAIEDWDGAINIWDTQNYMQVGGPINAASANSLLALDPSGRFLAMTNGFSGIEFWNITDSHLDKTLTIPSDTSVAISFSPDGKQFAAAGSDQEIYLWDMATFEPVRTRLYFHDKPITGLSFNPNNATLASSDNGGTVIEWGLVPQSLLMQVLPTHSDRVNAFVFNGSGKKLFSAGSDGIIQEWDTTTWHSTRVSTANRSGSIFDLALLPDERVLTIRDESWTVALWDGNTLKPLNQTLQVAGENLVSFAIHPEGNILAIGGASGKIFLWDLKTVQMIGTPLVGHQNSVTGLAFSPDGIQLASASLDRTAIIWDWENRKMEGKKIVDFKDFINSITFSPEGQMLAMGSCAQLSQSGVLCDKGEISIWDTASHRLIQSLIGHNEMVNSVIFSRDARFLASASLDGTIILWDANTFQKIGMPFESDAPSISSLSFSPDGNLLVAGGANGKIYVWDVNTKSWKDKACALAKRNLSQKEWKNYIPNYPYRITCPQWPAGE